MHYFLWLNLIILYKITKKNHCKLYFWKSFSTSELNAAGWRKCVCLCISLLVSLTLGLENLRYLFEKLAQIFCCKKNQNIEKIIFKVVQMKFLAMHINNQKLSFDIFTVGNLHNLHGTWSYFPNDFWHKIKSIILTHTCMLAIATNIAALLMTAFVLQGHICERVLRSLVKNTFFCDFCFSCHTKLSFI